MSWATLASNGLVSFTDAQGCGITQLHTLPTSQELMDKDDVLYYLNVDASYFSSLASNRLVWKDLFHAGTAAPSSFSASVSWCNSGGTAFDGTSGINCPGGFNRLVLYRGGTSVATSYTNSVGSLFDYTTNSVGMIYWTVRCYDNLGQYTDVAVSYNCTDVTLPSASLSISPVYTGENITAFDITVTGSDSGSGVAWVAIYCSGANSSTWQTNQYQSGLNNNPYTKRFSVGSSGTDFVWGNWYTLNKFARDFEVNDYYGSPQTFTPSDYLSAPSVTSGTSISSTSTTIQMNGSNVTASGGSTVTARGVAYGTSPNPTISGSCTTNGSGTGSFDSYISGLASGTTYYMRAYATNAQGTSYGTQQSIATSAAATVPTVTTTSISSITGSGATSGGNVTSDGGATVTARGICISTSPNPTTSSLTVSGGSGTGSFSATYSSGDYYTTYYVRAYATNSAGTAYGSEVSFTTDPDPNLVYSGSAPTSIGTTTADTYGIATAGNPTVTARGVCWGLSSNPTTSGNVVTAGSGSGVFYATLTGLPSGTVIHYRAYITNANGTYYGADISFTTH